MPDLDPRVARELTSREVAKLLGAFLGSMVGGGLSSPQATLDAIDHLVKYIDEYAALWKQAAAAHKKMMKEDAPDA